MQLRIETQPTHILRFRSERGLSARQDVTPQVSESNATPRAGYINRRNSSLGLSQKYISTSMASVDSVLKENTGSTEDAEGMEVEIEPLLGQPRSNRTLPLNLVMRLRISHSSPAMTTSNTSLIQQAHALALAAAKTAGDRIVEIRKSQNLGTTLKGARNLVTVADIEAEEIIRSAIQAAFPDHALLTEEGSPNYRGSALRHGPLWIIDPVDGTTNYARGLPSVSVSIALALDGIVQSAVVHAPFLSETFAAVKGQGATLNGVPIQAAPTEKLGDALIVTGFPYERTATPMLAARVKAILDHCQDLRRLGSAALDICNIACGRLDGYYETVNPWDMAAGALVAREAGVTVGQIHESSFNPQFPVDLQASDFLAAVPEIFQSLRSILQEADAS